MVTELVSAKLTLKSKSEQGYDLIAGESVGAVRASRIRLDRKAIPASAFQERSHESAARRAHQRRSEAPHPLAISVEPVLLHPHSVGARDADVDGAHGILRVPT